ncbi:MAG: hypothetical protein IT436_04590 [Phycisphaerales bacterium]|nr:hypothetical protein [Phycisphaerales bacterium]
MSVTLADTGMVDWANTVIAVAGLFAAGIALWQTRRSNRAAAEANTISREANALAGKANDHAEQALKLQEEEGKIRLVVKPRMMMVVSEDGDPEDDRRPRPVVEVVNLSAFPVTITGIHWKATPNADGKKGSFYWKNPTITNPYGRLPARLPPREAMTALGIPTSFKSLDDLASITAAVAYTACGEEFEGMTDQWKTEVARMVAEGKTGSPAKESTPDVRRDRM